MDESQANTIKLLWPLIGQWHGNGVAAFPTIPTFEYREDLEFAANQFQPFLRYEQRTWKKLNTGGYAPSHWEVGFLRVLPSNKMEILNAQGGGASRFCAAHLSREARASSWTLKVSWWPTTYA